MAGCMSDELALKIEREGFKLTSIKRRVLAYLIDDLLISLLLIITFWSQMSDITTTEALMSFMNQVALGIIGLKIVYQTLFVTLYGATLGKIFLKIRIVNVNDFDNPPFGISLLRAVIRALNEALFYIGFAWAFFDPLRQGWHDKLAKTVVIDA